MVYVVDPYAQLWKNFRTEEDEANLKKWCKMLHYMFFLLPYSLAQSNPICLQCALGGLKFTDQSQIDYSFDSNQHSSPLSMFGDNPKIFGSKLGKAIAHKIQELYSVEPRAPMIKTTSKPHQFSTIENRYSIPYVEPTFSQFIPSNPKSEFSNQETIMAPAVSLDGVYHNYRNQQIQPIMSKYQNHIPNRTFTIGHSLGYPELKDPRTSCPYCFGHKNSNNYETDRK
uniref:Uncharacterized protein n=1 Tax=Heterorhabditis bacteriophora TaxID=37862 RepID=A0A1I7XI22_HETBA